MKVKIIQKKTASIYIKCTLKNTLISVTDFDHNLLYQTSSKSYKAKMKRKNNAYVLHQLALEIINELKKSNIKKKYLRIYIKGVGAGRYNIIKHLKRKFKILLIEDRTNVPFNGCRPKKIKRK